MISDSVQPACTSSMRDNEFIRFLLDKKCLFGKNRPSRPATPMTFPCVRTRQPKRIGKPFSDDASGLQLILVMLHKTLGQLEVMTLVLRPSITLRS